MLSLGLLVRSRIIADKVTPETRSRIMSRIRSKDMVPEMIVRRLIYEKGYRYRLHQNNLPGKPDLVFWGRKKIILIHGCFWHQHPGCKDGHLPKSNLGYWAPKLERNVQRDKKVVADLTALGWEVLIIWECEIDDRDNLSVTLDQFLSGSISNK
jgi:DNA mismatch endonuclease (patch repair protein)